MNVFGAYMHTVCSRFKGNSGQFESVQSYMILNILEFSLQKVIVYSYDIVCTNYTFRKAFKIFTYRTNYSEYIPKIK